MLNVWILNLAVRLSSPKDETSQIVLSENRDKVRILHNGETISIQLPAQILGYDDLSFCLPKYPSLSAVTRLKAKPSSELLSATEGEHDPWSASSLTGAAEVRCVGSPGDVCDTALVERGRITQWKDLPSEGWAEMMDLWHCHKPHEPDHSEKGSDITEKGYAANNKLTAKEGVGLVNPISLLLTGKDCRGLKVSVCLSFHAYLPQLRTVLCPSSFREVPDSKEGVTL